jgi:hypothetical protein
MEVVILRRILTKILCVSCLTTSIIPYNAISVVAEVPTYTAQAHSKYNRLMQQGYDATRQKNYRQAKVYFQRALAQRPGDRYANTALNNLNIYIARDGRGKKSKRYVVYVPKGIGAPERTGIATTRNGNSTNLCNANSKPSIPLKALAPEGQLQLTTADFPRFWFYVPYTKAKYLEFTLQDDYNDIHHVKLATPPNPGIIGVNLPTNTNISQLEVGKKYTWSLSVVCNEEDRSKDIYVDGLVQKITPDSQMAAELAKASPLEKAAIYASSGVWQDSLATLVELRRTLPQDDEVRGDWEDLLRWQNLDSVAQQPFL